MHTEPTEPKIHGVMASFANAEELMAAADRARSEGFSRMDAYSPFPIEGLNEMLGNKHTRLSMLVLAGAIAGGLGGFLMQVWMEAIDYPKNIGGRPLISWPSFVPATFEMTILIGAFTAVIGMLALNGLPQPYHPVFNVPQFRTASRDGFFLCIESGDPKFDVEATKSFLESLNPLGVYEVES
jgi:hypothetical protein